METKWYLFIHNKETHVCELVATFVSGGDAHHVMNILNEERLRVGDVVREYFVSDSLTKIRY